VEQLRGLNDQLTALTQQRTQIAAIDTTPGYLTAPASLPLPSSHQHAVLYVLAGLVAGALIGTLATFAVESLDPRVRSGAQAQAATGAAPLGTVRRRRLRGDPSRADVGYAALAVADRSDVLTATPVVFLSPRTDSDRTRLVASIATALATQGHQVYLCGSAHTARELHDQVAAEQQRTNHDGHVGRALVEDATEPSGAQAAQEPRAGRRDTIGNAGTSPLGRLLVRTDPAHTDPAHPDPAHPDPGNADLEHEHPGPASTESPATLGSFAVGRGGVRFGPYSAAPAEGVLLVDAPPAEMDDRGVRAARGGGVVLVVACGHTRIAELSRLADRLRASGAVPLGFILTGAGRD
jgi:hypothetical protein